MTNVYTVLMSIKDKLRHTTSAIGLAGLMMFSGSSCNEKPKKPRINIHQVTGLNQQAVSYTHLTLPTICSV